LFTFLSLELACTSNMPQADKPKRKIKLTPKALQEDAPVKKASKKSKKEPVPIKVDSDSEAEEGVGVE